jgi:hypothetical protein
MSPSLRSKACVCTVFQQWVLDGVLRDLWQIFEDSGGCRESHEKGFYAQSFVLDRSDSLMAGGSRRERSRFNV